MARLPRRSPFALAPAPSSRSEENDRSTSFQTGLNTDDDARRLGGERHPVGSDEEVRLDAAIEAMLAAGGVDPVTRVRLNEARQAMTLAKADQEADGFAGASLANTLFQAVMPRLKHPEVLRAERQRSLLEDLADGLTDAPDDGIAMAGAMIIYRELHRLTLVRTARNALVQG